MQNYIHAESYRQVNCNLTGYNATVGKLVNSRIATESFMLYSVTKIVTYITKIGYLYFQLVWQINPTDVKSIEMLIQSLDNRIIQRT